MKLKNRNTSLLRVILPTVFYSVLIASSFGLGTSHISTYNDKPVVDYLGQELVSKVVANVSSPVALLFSFERGDVLVATPSMDKIFILEHGTYQVVSNISLSYAPVALAWDTTDGNIYVGVMPGSVTALDGDELNLVGVASIPSPVGLSYDVHHNIVYAVSNTSNNVYVINASSTNIIKTISVCCTPTSLAYNSVNGYLYVAESASNTVAVISPINGSSIANISVGSDPQYILDEGSYLYVANFNSNTVSVIDGLTNNVVESINVGSEPDSIAYNSFNGCYYVANYGSSDVSQICEGSVTSTFNVGSEPDYLIYDPTEWSIIVANYGSGSISEISTPNAPSLPTSSTSQATSSTQSVTLSSSTSNESTTTVSSFTTSSDNSSTTSQNKSNEFSIGYLATISIVVIAFFEFGLLVYFIRKRNV